MSAPMSPEPARDAELVRYPKAENCPREWEHTPAPSGYIARHEWFQKMAKTHRQQQCPECLYWVIWVPKGGRTDG